MKPLEKSFKEAALAVIAAENGIISPTKLVYVLSKWINDPGSSIIKRLKEVLPPDSIDLLDLLDSGKNRENGDSDPVSVLIESVERIKERTNLAVAPSASGENTASDKLITDESPGRYVVQSEIARGGAGRVLVALDRHLGREIAMKELLLDLRDLRDGEKRLDPHTKSLRNRFLREARVTGQLEHPSIVPVYEIGQHPDGVFYYTMRMVKGRTLSKAIKQCRSLSERMELLPHFYNICNAVAYAHSKGVLNRDLKPSNVMIGEFGETVVLDWGLAKVKGQYDAGADKIQSGLRLFANADVGRTVVGFAIGTPSYMPPEQAEGNIDEIDETSDIYSLGAILYQLLTDKPPYKGKSASEILRKVVLADLTPVSGYEPEASAELAAIAEKALSKDKTKRYQSATELIDELNSYMSGEKISGYKYSFFELIKKFTSRNKTIFISSLLIFLVLVMSTLSVTWYYKREVKARESAQAEKMTSQFRAAQAFNEKAMRLELEKRFLSSRIYAAASILYNPANINSPHYDPDHRIKFKSALPLLADSSSRFYQRHFHRGAVFEKGKDISCRIIASAISADGTILITGCDNGEIRAFDSKSLKEIFKLDTNSPVTGISISKNDNTVVFSSASGNISLLDTDTGKTTLLHKMPGGSECVNISDSGENVVSCGRDGTIKVTSISNKETFQIKEHKDSVKDAGFINNDRYIISVGQDNTLKKFDFNLNREVNSLKLSDELITSLKISPDETIALIGTESGEIHIVDIETMSLQKSLENQTSMIVSLCFSSDGSMFLASDIQKKTVVWDFLQSIPLFTIEGHGNSITNAMFTESGDYIISTGVDGFIRFWKLHGRKPSALFTIDGHYIKDADFAGNFAGMVSRTDHLDLFNLTSGKHHLFEEHSGPIFDFAAGNDGKLGAVAGWSTEITVFDIIKNKTTTVFKGNENAVTRLKFSNDNKHLMSAGRDGSIRSFSLVEEKQTGMWKCREGVAKSIDISYNGKLVAVVCEDNEIYVLSAPELRKTGHIKMENSTVNTIAFVPGKEILVSGSDNGIFQIDIKNKEPILLSGYSGYVTKVAFSKNGQYLASSGRDLSVKIWDMNKSFPILTINTEREPGCIVFAPDNKGLLVCDGNRARIWPLEFIELDKDPLELLREMEKDAAMKLKDFYLEPGI